MVKIALIMCLLVATSIATKHSLRAVAHDYWYTAAKSTATTGVSYADYAWNYCDLKCIYMEKYNVGVDFVVVNFEGSSFKPNFAACYAKTAAGDLVLWHKVYQNTLYEQLCGGDDNDYLKDASYKVASKAGEGLGTEIDYEAK